MRHAVDACMNICFLNLSGLQEVDIDDDNTSTVIAHY